MTEVVRSAMAVRLVSAAMLAALLVAGCGAKTGLEVPDASLDSGLDAGVAMDAGTDASIPCIEVPPDAGTIQVPLDIEAQLARADVLFLVDTTASMGEEIDRIRTGLRDRIAPGIADAIPDSELGVAHFEDFPTGRCGESSDNPFELLSPITADLNRAQAAVDALMLGNGLDRPEAQVEALYQVATGEGLGSYIMPSFGCPSGGVGYPCFRPDALPIVLLFTDAPFHNGPGGTNPYSCTVVPTPHTYEQAVTALNALEIKVMGMYSGTGEGRSDMMSIAGDTGALEGGMPLVFDIGTRGERLSDQVVTAIRTLADVIQFDVDAIVTDPDPTDGVDVTAFVQAVVPLRADPMSRITGIDTATNTFLGVRAGTRVYFQLELRNDLLTPGPTPQRFLLEIVFRGDRRTRLGSRLVEIVVPAADGTGCSAR